MHLTKCSKSPRNFYRLFIVLLVISFLGTSAFELKAGENEEGLKLRIQLLECSVNFIENNDAFLFDAIYNHALISLNERESFVEDKQKYMDEMMGYLTAKSFDDIDEIIKSYSDNGTCPPDDELRNLYIEKLNSSHKEAVKIPDLNKSVVI